MTSKSFHTLPTHLCCVLSSNFLAVTGDKIVSSVSKDPTFQLGLITSTQRNHSLLPLLFFFFFFLTFSFVGFSLPEYGTHYTVVSLSLKRKEKKPWDTFFLQLLFYFFYPCTAELFKEWSVLVFSISLPYSVFNLVITAYRFPSNLPFASIWAPLLHRCEV